jgi:hypothetical protein
MIIAVAGPYSAPSETERKKNLDAMNAAAARLLEMGHTPLIGVNAALPVLEKSSVADPYEAIMAISMAVVSAADAILLIGESPGANREKNFLESRGKKVFRSLDEIPPE